MLTFDAIRHVYHWNGMPVPNVTRVLAPWTDFSHIPADTLERARQQGVAVHKMVEADCNGSLMSVPDWMAGHRGAWELFKSESGFVPWAAEFRSYHPKVGVAGTMDLAGELPRLKNVNGPAILDVKRSFYAGPIIGLQVAAYRELWNAAADKSGTVPVANRFALRLDADGKYRLQRFPDPEDWIDFLAALRQHRFREKHYVRRSEPVAA